MACDPATSRRLIGARISEFGGTGRPRRFMAANRNRASIRTQGTRTTPTETVSSTHQSGTVEDIEHAFRPLRIVVKDAVKRWFNEAHKEALKGDTKQQALLGQMMIEGYGCSQDTELGKEWTERARKRGYKMAGVYCEL